LINKEGVGMSSTLGDSRRKRRGEEGREVALTA
jgi:hypothetical protein